MATLCKVAFSSRKAALAAKKRPTVAGVTHFDLSAYVLATIVAVQV